MRFAMLGAVDAAAVPSRSETSALAEDARLSRDEWIAVAATLAGGAIGGFAWKKHPVLGVMNGAALAGNTARVINKEISPRRALENLGAHAVATAGALALSPAGYGWLGYLAGAAGSNVFIRRADTFLERLDETVLGGEVLDTDILEGEVVEEDGQTIIRARLGATDWFPAPSLEAVRNGLQTLKRGHKGDAVLRVQGIVGDSAYAQAGFQADSEYGDQTEAAVKKFQAAKGLPVTGVVDASTMRAIDAVAGDVGGVSTVDFTKSPATTPASTPVPSTSMIKTAAASSPEEGKGGGAAPGTLFGRPTWQVVLAGAGILLAGGGLVYSLGSGDRILERGSVT